jgi:glycosyl hydrolase family 62
MAGAGGAGQHGGAAGYGGTAGSSAGGSGGSGANGGTSTDGGSGTGAGGSRDGGSGAGAGGTSTGGAGGTGAGGSSGASGSKDAGADSGSSDGGQVCDLPTTFRWRSSGPLVAPKSPAAHDFVSIKDPSVVYWNNQFHVHATVYDQTVKGWNMVYLSFSDWSQANAASQFYMQNSPTRGGVAPQLFYFTPKKKWVLVYQWGASFSTTDDPSRPETWTPRAPLLNNAPSGALDFWVICDSANCYLFFSNDLGQLYQAKMPIDQFPSAFDNARVLMSDTAGNLFEASNVYKIRGTSKYLLLVEAYGPRYFRSWTATNLEGPWAPLAATQQNPFAGKANVTFDGSAWTNDISHGDMVRTNPDETMTIDACDMQFAYQGADPNANPGGDYALIPYRLGLLTLTR